MNQSVYPLNYQMIANQLGVSLKTTMVLLTVIALWSLIWKGFALWKSARKQQLPWFIVLLIFNTVGILPILYLFIFSKIKLNKTPSKKTTKKKPVKKKTRKTQRKNRK